MNVIIEGLKFNQMTFGRVATQFSHEESLESPSMLMNCANWLAGHIVVTRKDLVGHLNLSFDLRPEVVSQYRRGSKLSDPTLALPYNEIMELFEESQKILEQGISNMSLDDQKLAFVNSYLLHESYHIGQIGIIGRYLNKKGLA